MPICCYNQDFSIYHPNCKGKSLIFLENFPDFKYVQSVASNTRKTVFAVNVCVTNAELSTTVNLTRFSSIDGAESLISFCLLNSLMYYCVCFRQSIAYCIFPALILWLLN